MYKASTPDSLKRRSAYPGVYDFFSGKSSWDLGTSLIEYPLYLLKVLKTKHKFSKLSIPRALLGCSIKLAVKAAFIILVMRLYETYK